MNRHCDGFVETMRWCAGFVLLFCGIGFMVMLSGAILLYEMITGNKV